jgi:hypothetical protein
MKSILASVLIVTFATAAWALTDERLVELDAQAAAAEAHLKDLGEGADEVHANLLRDVATKARNLAMAERRKRRMVGDGVTVASFDAQMGVMEAEFEAAVARLRDYETARTSTNATAVTAPPPLPEGL